MAPKKHSRGHFAPSAAAPLSQREVKQSARKKMQSTREKLDAFEAEKKAKYKAKEKKPAPVPLAEVDQTALRPLDELLVPARALVDELLAKLMQAEEELISLQTGLPILEEPEAERAPVENKESAALPAMATAKAVSVWKETVADGLAEMGSSLQGALLCDTKLRAIFDKIDLDRGGTIDRTELRAALSRAGKSLSDEQIEVMMKTADTDQNGEVSFEEFADVLKGVKAARAANIIENRFRQKKLAQSSKKLQKKAVHDIAQSKVLDRRGLDRALGHALLRQENPKELLREWDRKQKGAINRIEFRTGVRDKLGLNFENKDLDQWFDILDRDGSGTIEEAELKEALQMLREKAVHEEARRQQVRCHMFSCRKRDAPHCKSALLDRHAILVVCSWSWS